MIDGMMKAFFAFAKITPEKANEMVKNTYTVVETIGKDMSSINARLAAIEAKLGAETKLATDNDNVATHN
jgi:hypothetical protein